MLDLKVTQKYIYKIEKENRKLEGRIYNAIKYIKKIIIHGESEHPFTEFAIDFKNTKEGKELLDILKGEENEN